MARGLSGQKVTVRRPLIVVKRRRHPSSQPRTSKRKSSYPLNMQIRWQFEGFSIPSSHGFTRPNPSTCIRSKVEETRRWFPAPPTRRSPVLYLHCYSSPTQSKMCTLGRTLCSTSLFRGCREDAATLSACLYCNELYRDIIRNNSSAI